MRAPPTTTPTTGATSRTELLALIRSFSQLGGNQQPLNLLGRQVRRGWLFAANGKFVLR